MKEGFASGGKEDAPSVLLVVLGVLEENNCMHLANRFSKNLQLILSGRAGDAADKHFCAVRRLRHGVIRTACMHGESKQHPLQRGKFANMLLACMGKYDCPVRPSAWC